MVTVARENVWWQVLHIEVIFLMACIQGSTNYTHLLIREVLSIKAD
jgi:hypothetical protein